MSFEKNFGSEIVFLDIYTRSKQPGKVSLPRLLNLNSSRKFFIFPEMKRKMKKGCWTQLWLRSNITVQHNVL